MSDLPREKSENVVRVWSPVKGDTFDASGQRVGDPAVKAATKPALVRLVVSTRLEESPAWVTAADRVRGGEDPYAVADYGNGARRRVIVELLVASACGRANAFAFTVPETPERSSYSYSTRFWAKMLRGADCLVRLGAGECFGCGERLPFTRFAKGGDSGRTALITRCEGCDDPSEVVADRHALEGVFEHLAAALPDGTIGSHSDKQPLALDEQILPPEHASDGGAWTPEAREAWLSRDTIIAPETQGICHGCAQPILSGQGVTVDTDRNHWHPACRKPPRGKGRWAQPVSSAATSPAHCGLSREASRSVL